MLKVKNISIVLLLQKRKFLTIFFFVFLFVFIPQINLTDYPQSTITSKFIVFAFFCIGFFVFSILWILKSKKINISLSNLDIILLILFIYFSINRYFFQPDYSFSIRHMELLGLGFLYVIFRALTIKTFYWLLLTIVVSGIIQAIYGNLQLLGYFSSNHSGFKLTGSFFNPGPYAGFLIAVFPTALGLYLFKEKITSKLLINIDKKENLTLNTIIKYLFEYIPLLGIVSIFLVIPATQSRAAWLAVLLGSILFFELRYQIILRFFKKLSKAKKITIITLFLLIIGSGLFGIYHFKKGSSDGRLFIWKVSTEIIKDNPFFGVGFDRFKAHYMNYQASYFSEKGETIEALVADNSNYAFNEFIQIITEQGLISFVLLMFLLFFIVKASVKKENKEANSIIKIGLLSIGVFALFSYPMQILPIKLILVFLLGGLAILDQNKIKLLQNFKITIVLKTLLICVVLTGTALSFNYIKKVDKSFKKWNLAQSNYQYGDYEEAIEEFEMAYPMLKNNGDFLMNYGKALSIYKQNKKAIEILTQSKQHLNNTIIQTAIGDAYKADKQYTKAEFAYAKAYNMIPVRFYPLYLLAKLFDESNQKVKAINIANKVLQKEIKVPSTAIKEIQLEMKKIIQKE